MSKGGIYSYCIFPPLVKIKLKTGNYVTQSIEKENQIIVREIHTHLYCYLVSVIVLMNRYSLYKKKKKNPTSVRYNLQIVSLPLYPHYIKPFKAGGRPRMQMTDIHKKTQYHTLHI